MARSADLYLMIGLQRHEEEEVEHHLPIGFFDDWGNQVWGD
jgi:hypothetical protein